VAALLEGFSHMEKFFKELGQAVLAQWKAENFSLPAFPGIATAALEGRPPARHVDLDELIRDFLLSDDQPRQTQSGFGQPELVVFEDARMYIQVLFWLEGTTDIHQHEFSGAFHVLAGSSIHSMFAFENARSISAHLRVGDLRMKETHLLETGSTVAISSGREYIHSLFHLDTPSATVVVRTQTDPGTGPQFTYLPPHLAIDPIQDDALTMRRKQLLDVLEKTGDASYPELVATMVNELDFERGFYILQNSAVTLREIGEWESVWEVFQRRHGKFAEYVPPTLDQIARRDGIATMRGAVTDVEHRFFLALLLNVPTREGILGMVAQRFPDQQPAAIILRWAGELLEVSDDEVWLIDAEFPDFSEIPAEDRPEVFLAALGHFMGAEEAPEVDRAELASLRNAFSRSSWGALLS
jgi:hypothetical protein